MSKKPYRFHAMIGVHDPSQDILPVIDPASKVVLVPGSNGVKFIPAGEPVELEEAEGNRIMALVGPYRPPVAAAQAQVMR